MSSKVALACYVLSHVPSRWPASFGDMYVQLSRGTNDERGVKLGYLPNMG
jgi:hypothetical protein